MMRQKVLDCHSVDNQDTSSACPAYGTNQFKGESQKTENSLPDTAMGHGTQEYDV